jgi:hypothetical protein
VLTTTALEALARQLDAIIASMDLNRSAYGRPELVHKATQESERIAQGHAKAHISSQNGYAVALAFLRGRTLDEQDTDIVASALCEPVREMAKARVIGDPRLETLLQSYETMAAEGYLWRLTWFGLLGSYFALDPSHVTEDERQGWRKLRRTLQSTWPTVDRETGSAFAPVWMKAVRADTKLLTSEAAQRYGLDYLRGDETSVRRLADDLRIPDTSWFWHALVLSAVKHSAEQSDTKFKESIPRLLNLLDERSANRDEALEILLTRYHRCARAELHRELRDFVVRKDVWRNPKLREAGLATAWNRVDDNVWRMVLQWVNEANLKDFFEILAARRNSDEGRLAFWSQFLEQITWTRLIFSPQTKTLAANNAAIRNLIAREEESYASISSGQDVDAFMLQLGDYVFIEFSKTPNAAYGYQADQLPFEPYARDYTGTQQDLKFGYRGEKAAHIRHHQGWEAEAELQLRRLDIHPDRAQRAGRAGSRLTRSRGGQTQGEARDERAIGAGRESERGAGRRGAAAEQARELAPAGAPFSMADIDELVAHYPGAYKNDMRRQSSGRLWVVDPDQRVALGAELQRLKFKWAAARQAWYFPEA